MLRFKELSSRRNLCELHAKSICSQLIGICTSFSSFESNFFQDLNKIARVNTSHCADWYKLEILQDKIILWHVDVQGDYDRKVGEITDDGIVAPDPFNF